LASREWYADALGVLDYRVQIKRIHEAGYATDPNYSEKVIRIIEQHDLREWDLITFIQEYEGIVEPKELPKDKPKEQPKVNEKGGDNMAVVWLDGGHGGRDSGAVGNGIREKDIALKIAKRVGEILTKNYSGITVKYSRTTDKYLSLKQRTDMANKANADFFFSIHVNAGGGTGYEDYIYNKLKTNGSTDKKRQKIHNAVKPVLSKYGIRNRGMKKANFHVLRETKMPAVLVETLFIDTKKDANLLKNANFIEDISQAYAKGIADIFGAKRKSTPKPQPKPSSPKGTIYRVQVGAFKSKANAQALEKKVEAKGFDAFVKYVDGLYKVQVGAYSVKANAERQRDRLKKAGFDAFITTK
jgi:N-acetylmuramoyl-L-alanine amidase